MEETLVNSKRKIVRKEKLYNKIAETLYNKKLEYKIKKQLTLLKNILKKRRKERYKDSH